MSASEVDRHSTRSRRDDAGRPVGGEQVEVEELVPRSYDNDERDFFCAGAADDEGQGVNTIGSTDQRPAG
jgi:hypothetical protein